MIKQENKIYRDIANCMISTAIIDVPVRGGVARYAGLPLTYVGISALVTAGVCIAQKTWAETCKDSSLCVPLGGMLGYAARAYTVGQNPAGRAVVGTYNSEAYSEASKLGAKSAVVKYGAPIAIEAFEAAFVAIITGADISTSIKIGVAVGSSLSVLVNIVAPAIFATQADEVLAQGIKFVADSCLSGDSSNITQIENTEL